jgi:hypothetical protein
VLVNTLSESPINKRILLAAAVLLIILAASLSIAFFLNQEATKLPETSSFTSSVPSHQSPSQLASSSSKPEVDVFSIGKRYVEENYGADYAVNGGVSEATFSNGTGTWTYPSVSFRVPADWQKPGTLITVMVNPQTGEVFRVLSQWSKSMPPSTPVLTENPHYPIYPSFNGDESKIYLANANGTYGAYPFASVPQMGSNPGIEKDAPCFIINLTVRNDYTDQNPLPGSDLWGRNNTDASIFLTAKICNAQGAIAAVDVTPPYPGIPYSGAYIGLSGGETTTKTIYLATNHTDIDHFEIVVEYIGAIPPP